VTGDLREDTFAGAVCPVGFTVVGPAHVTFQSEVADNDEQADEPPGGACDTECRQRDDPEHRTPSFPVSRFRRLPFSRLRVVETPPMVSE
jgi:hypothetical protein